VTGATEHAVVLQAASLLLQYPDRRWRERLPVVEEALRRLPPGAPRAGLLALVEHARPCRAADLEEHYVEVFDRRRRCCLHLTWWTDGETRRRGLALARLKALYRTHGFELQGGELPDYLPVVLEFAAQGDVTLGLHLLQEHRPAIELLRLALTDIGTPYASVLTGLCALLPGVSPADEAAAVALARNGPPGESVGLTPYGAPGAPGRPGADPPAGPGPTSLEFTGVRR
jgi:nitrate reductase molybdenum cofactor assembly chaperone NarJ/NarW